MIELGMKITFVDPSSGGSCIEATAREKDTLLDVIRGVGLPIEALCSGRGTCGKCRVRVDGVEGLACKTDARDGQRVEILFSSGGQEILTDSGAGFTGTASGKTAVAIDIGTTTVVVKEIDTGSGEEIGVRAFTNPQRTYGADVLSRINNAMDDATLLSVLIRGAVDQAVLDILRKEGVDKAIPDKVVIAGNTTMLYLLLGLRCRSLGLAPFEPEYVIEPVYAWRMVFGTDTLSCPVLIYPYISAFVGGDIVSGLVHIETHYETDPAPSYMLVDMGTNGEIAYRSGSGLLTTSTAAGPALEGGNITCGMSGLPGAICETAYDGEGRFSYKTIGGKTPVGICGSGVIDLMATLLDAGLVSESGAFTEAADRIAENTGQGSVMKQLVIAEAAEPDGARVVFTQKDVREFQLAKGAIRAGIDILTEEVGAQPEVFYLAGGFGQNIHMESAFRVGLIPRALNGHVRFVGNTSLGGSIDACMRGGSDAPLPSFAVTNAAREINLGAHKSFNNKFMETMMF